ncbi:CwfJ domain containing protein [Nitzschia inconspicua]|uniref:CwfJ domain containing protein n=1 Tax=Nitzschia inconspicua TaxID=303405 RepID=A0A9K3PWZ4_9STRA|nr:CwfJ domain containing protein [Nitzschia inconspicua]
MLSGIRTGKKKTKAALTGSESRRDGVAKEPPPHTTRTFTSHNKNLSIAEQLKQALAEGKPLPSNLGNSHGSSSYMDRVTSKSAAADTTEKDPSFVLLDGPETAFSSSGKREEDMTITELAAKERIEAGMSWNEHAARNVVRVGKKRKVKEKNTNVDSDEEIERMKRHMPDNTIKKSTKQVQKEQERERLRHLTQYQKQEKVTSMCSWWINSSNFTKHRLLAFGKHVSLMMAPLNASLDPGHQFYLVPLKHAPSFVDCDDDGIWEEVALFRRSLENMYAKERKGIILVETVLPNKGFWQTKMDVIPVPFSALQDAPIFFKSSMVEQADEFGTHNKLLKTSVQKPLRSVIPKKFPYFYIDWGNIATSSSTGYAQIIESSEFRHDFGLDTLAGMLNLDPIRFHRKRSFPPDTERTTIAEFQSKWKDHDWTSQLEDE